MRIALSFIIKIFIKGYSNCIEVNICSEVRGTGPSRFNLHVNDIENKISTEIFSN